jgi:hypothetical protein
MGMKYRHMMIWEKEECFKRREGEFFLFFGFFLFFWFLFVLLVFFCSFGFFCEEDSLTGNFREYKNIGIEYRFLYLFHKHIVKGNSLLI